MSEPWEFFLPSDQAGYPPSAGHVIGNCVVIGFDLPYGVPNSITLGEGDCWVRIHADGRVEWPPACNAARVLDAVRRALTTELHAARSAPAPPAGPAGA